MKKEFRIDDYRNRLVDVKEKIEAIEEIIIDNEWDLRELEAEKAEIEEQIELFENKQEKLK
jgi:hypothetical protein